MTSRKSGGERPNKTKWERWTGGSIGLKELLVQGSRVSEQEIRNNGQGKLNEMKIMGDLQLLVIVISKSGPGDSD